MKAIILVGGEGTRLRPLTCQTPKAMVPVLNRPFLEHVVERLRQHSIDTIILTLCYLPEPIQSYFGDGSRFGVKMVYIEEKVPLGTAGAVKNAQVLFDSPFFVLNGDVFTDLDYTGMMEAHLKNKAVASIALTPVEDVTRYGVVETGEGGRIKRFVEKPKPNEVSTNMINAGTYVLNPDLLHNIPANTTFSFERQLFPLLLGKGEVLFSYASDAYWIDIGKPDNYMELNYHLLTVAAGRNGKTRTEKGVQVGKGTSIHSSAKIEGPVVIGEGCRIEENVLIKGPSIIGNSCRVSQYARLSEVILWNGVTIGKSATLERCVVANNCLVNDNCCVGEGCVMGDNVTVKPDCVIEPGCKVWPGTLVG